MYISKKTNASVGGWIRDKMGFSSSNAALSPQLGASGKKSDRKVRIADEDDINMNEDIDYNWKRGS